MKEIEIKAIRLGLEMCSFSDYTFDIEEEREDYTDFNKDFLYQHEDFIKEHEITKEVFQYVTDNFLGWDKQDIQEYVCNKVICKN